jgi:uncharacterized membrane protein
MKTKSIALSFATILTFFLVMSSLSAALVIVGDATVAVTETSATANFIINNTDMIDMVSVTLSTTEADFPYTLTNSISATNDFDLGVGELATITITATDLSDLILGVNNVKVLATANDSTAVTMTATAEGEFCTYEDNDDLRINSLEFNNRGKFGDDDNWLPFEEIEVSLEIENSAPEDIENIEIEWALYDSDGNEIISDDVDTDLYDEDLDEDDEMDIEFTIALDDNIEDLEDGGYTFVISATGEIQDDNDTDTCTSEIENIDVVIEKDFVIATDIRLPETAECGDEITLTADIWNIGEDKQKDIIIAVSESSLGILEVIEMDDIKALDDEKLTLKLTIPENAEEGSYIVMISVHDDDDDVYEYDDENSEFPVSLIVTGCAIQNPVEVSAIAKSGGTEGKETVIELTVVNTGSETTIYSLRALGFDSWADGASLDKSTFALESGRSETILITLDVKDGSVGDNQFDIEVRAGEEIVESKSILVPIEEKKGFSLPSSIRDAGKSLIGIVLLNIILIVAIIVVVVKIIRKK